jgi:hypothetical protein
VPKKRQHAKPLQKRHTTVPKKRQHAKLPQKKRVSKQTKIWHAGQQRSNASLQGVLLPRAPVLPR